MPRLLASAVVAAALAARLSTSAAEGASGYHRMHQVEVVDQHGFERPMRALSLLVPVDWKLVGGVEYTRKLNCLGELVRTTFRAESADGRTAVELLPGSTWNWSDDPGIRQAAEANNRQMAQFGSAGCDLRPPLSAREFLTRVVIPRARKGAEVVAVEPVPRVDEPLRQQARAAQAQAAQAGLQVRITADHARARIRYLAGGNPVEEWLTAVTFVRASHMPAFDARTGGMRQASWYDCSGQLVFGLRAPAGALEANEKLFDLVLSTLRIDPEWQRRVAQAMGNMQAAQLKGAQDRSRIISQSNQEIGQIIRQGYEDRQRRRGRLRPALQRGAARRADVSQPRDRRAGGAQQPVRARLGERPGRVRPLRIAVVRSEHGAARELDGAEAGGPRRTLSRKPRAGAPQTKARPPWEDGRAGETLARGGLQRRRRLRDSRTHRQVPLHRPLARAGRERS